MLYFYQLTGEFGISRQDACKRANTSAPEGSPVIGKFVGYQDGNPPEHNQLTHVAVEIAPAMVDGFLTQQWRIDPLPQEQATQNLHRAREAVWEAIKAERDRRASLGVKVGSDWFHSDQKSRTQQLGLVLIGANIPSGLQWKTLTASPTPVFVTMTPALAQNIVAATAASDAAIFTAAEQHRIALKSSSSPKDYDFSVGWPTSIEDEANEAGITFNQSLL